MEDYPSLLKELTADVAKYQQQLKKTKLELYQQVDNLKSALNIQNNIIQALESERQLLKAAIRNIPAGVIIAEKKSEKPILTNPQVGKIWRKTIDATAPIMSHEQLTGYHEEDGHAYESHEWPIMRSLQKGDVIRNEVIGFQRADDSLGYLQVSSSPIYNDKEQMIAAVEIFTDITRRRKAEMALSASEQSYRELIETIPHGIDVIDLDGTIQFANNNLHQIYATAPGTLTGSSILDRVASEVERDILIQELQYLIKHQPEPETYFGKKRREDGQLIDVQVDWNYKRDANGDVIGFISVITDITKRKQAEQQLRETEQMHKNVFETAWNGIIIFNPDGHFIECNPAFTELFGYSKQELHDIKVRQLLDPKDHHKLAGFKALLNKNRKVNAEITALAKDGRSFPIEIVTGASFLYHGEAALLTFIRDLTESKEIEKQLRQHQLQLAHASRMNTLGEMTAGIAHEINQPLGAIMNYTRGAIRRMQSDQYDPETIIPAITEVAKQAERAGEIIHRLRRFARKGELQHTQTCINNAVTESISFLQPEISEHKIIIRKKLSRRLPTTIADKIQIEQVLVNIIKNAIDAVRHCEDDNQRRIYIQTSLTSHNAIEILIHDFGPGFDQQTQAKIFDPFFTTKDDGMGIGLAISQGIIEAHKGTISAVPAPKEGACFKITLPVLTTDNEEQA